ncbi:MAG: exopolysaccharide biosynthesis polyprenyl glycosylphosphotransferase [Candidatus Omnitrophota bacterium]
MKKGTVFSFFILDAGIIFGSFFFSYWFRFETNLFPVRVGPPLAVYAKMAGLSALGWVVILKGFGLYRQDDFPEFLVILLRLLQGTFWATVLLLSGTFFYRSVEFSRLVIGIAILISFFLLYFFRLISWYAGAFFGESAGLLIVGSRETAGKLADRLIRHRIPYRVRGFLDISQEGGINELDSLPFSEGVTGLIITEKLPEEILSRLIDKVKEKRVRIFYLPEYHQVARRTASFVSLAGLPLLTFAEMPLERFGNRLVKRAVDLVFGILLTLFFIPFLILSTVLIKLTSPGPVFFRQERIGFGGKPFSIFKFRTMAPASEGKAWTEIGDERLTEVGKFLRRFNLDELPQIFNVLFGQMSLVGPRPIATADASYFQVSYFERRLTVKPGLTGWAQVHGLRGGHLLPEERLAYDLFYIENWSVWLDLVILLATPFAFRNAY